MCYRCEFACRPAGLGQKGGMNKLEIIRGIVARLEEKVGMYRHAAQAAHEEATHEESKAEDKYDTRGLEASYLAAGQARHMEEAAAALQDFSTMFVKKFAAAEPIDVSALVQIETRKQKQMYFVGPGAGGIEVEHQGQSVLVITPQSPLGRQLVGRKKGDKFKLKIGPFTDEYKIVSVA
jgi:transcription elongation GreA/GreB family factor